MNDRAERPRSRSDHLDDAEVAIVKERFRNRVSNRKVADELNCSVRTITRHYSLLRAEGIPRARASRAGQDSKPQDAPPATERPSRFYKSTFEL
jgi:DNA-binding transcriptional MocR family regulator